MKLKREMPTSEHLKAIVEVLDFRFEQVFIISDCDEIKTDNESKLQYQ